MVYTTVKIKKLHPQAVLPKLATPEAGAVDVVCTEVGVGEIYAYCKLGFALEIPENHRVMIHPRSSVSKTGWILANGVGIVDSDYRGEVELRFVRVPILEKSWVDKQNMDHLPFPFKPGDRVGQIYLEKILPISFEEVTELTNTTRGSGGFGSTDENIK